MNAYRVVRSSHLAGLFSFSLLDGLHVRLPGHRTNRVQACRSGESAIQQKH